MTKRERVMAALGGREVDRIPLAFWMHNFATENSAGGLTAETLRLARTFDGWCPIVENPDAFAADVQELREVLRKAGRDPDRFQLSPFVDPEGDLSPAALAAYRRAGASRLVLFSQKAAAEIADGAALEWIERNAPIVERARLA